MTAYEEGLPVVVAFAKPPKMSDILGQVIADAGLAQFRCAETEKFAHVTFFFNDYREEPFPGERSEPGRNGDRSSGARLLASRTPEGVTPTGPVVMHPRRQT